jgi:hypothetical protein
VPPKGLVQHALSGALFPQQEATAPKELGGGCPAKLPESSRHALVRQSPELLGHGKAPISEVTFRRRDLEMKRVREIGARQRDREREAWRRQVELIHRYNDERPSFGLFRATGRIGG